MKLLFVHLVMGILACGIGRSEVCPLVEGISIRTITLIGLRSTHSWVVWQEMFHRPGGTFSCHRWEEEQLRLKDLGVFASVRLETEMLQDSANLVYRFRELPPYLPMLTVNNTDQDGLSIGPHVAALNLFGTTKKAHLMARFLGTTEYQVLVSGRQLNRFPVEFEVAWFHVDSHNPYDHYLENSHRFKTEAAWPRNRKIEWIGLAEWFWIKADTSGITLRPGGDIIPRIGLGTRFDSRDRVLFPRLGFFSEARLTQSGGWLGGPADYVEWLGDMRGYLPFSVRHGATVSALYQYRNPGPLGRYDLFHAGGANSLRGYAVNSLRGRNELLMNGEFRYDAVPEKVQSLSVLGPWSFLYGVQWVAGADMAGLWSHSGLLGRNFETGIYAGINLLVPGLNRVRLEFGTSAGEMNWRADIGLFEKTSAQRLRTR